MEGVQTLPTQATWEKQALLEQRALQLTTRGQEVERRVLQLACSCLSCPLLGVAAVVAAVVVADKEHLFLLALDNRFARASGLGFLQLHQQSHSVCCPIKRRPQWAQDGLPFPLGSRYHPSTPALPSPLPLALRASTFMVLHPAGILISRHDSISSLANRYVERRFEYNSRWFLQRLRCHGLQRKPTNRIRQHIIRPTAALSVLMFPIAARCAKVLKTLLLWLQHSLHQSRIRLLVGKLVLFAESPPSPGP